MRLLISWLAFNNDFDGGKASKNGPTYKFHQHFFDYDKHIILLASKKDETRAEHLLSLLKNGFKDREIITECLNVEDIINVNEIKTKVEGFLLKHSKEELDVFVSPGTPAMQVAWYLCYLNPALKLTLFQTRSEVHTKTGKPDLIKIELTKSNLPTTAILFQENIEGEEYDKEYLISESIKEVYSEAQKIASTDDVTTLILGESGTGKEHLANYIHVNSIRNGKSYLTLNCSAFNDQLLESRLFGYKKGAFTGAEKDTPGLFEEAKGGTIFLDEIGDISSYMQQSLLRVLQSKEIMPVGGKPTKIDVRIIAATNKDLPKMCEEGKFRWDLYYRLSVVELQLPALVSRGKNEIKEMIQYFIAKKKKELRKSKKLSLSQLALEKLTNYTYPGNVRELENLISRLYVFFDENVDVKDLPERILQSPVQQPLNWEYIEKTHIERVLKLKNGNQRQTAIAIGWSINTLKAKIKHYSIVI